MVNDVYKFKISRESRFHLENVAHVRSHKNFYHISFEIPDFVRLQNPGNRFLFSEPVRPLVNAHAVINILNLSYVNSFILYFKLANDLHYSSSLSNLQCS